MRRCARKSARVRSIKRRRKRTVQRVSNPSPSSTVAIPSAKRSSPPQHDIPRRDPFC